MLTPAQELKLKTDVQTDPQLSLLTPSDDNAFAISEAYKVIVIPGFIIWKTRVSQDEITQNGFDWVSVDNLSVGKARIWEWLFDNGQQSINPSKSNVRAGIDECWKGTAAMLAVRASVYTHCKKSANRLEKLLSSGSGTNDSPATIDGVSEVSYAQVKQALGW